MYKIESRSFVAWGKIVWRVWKVFLVWLEEGEEWEVVCEEEEATLLGGVRGGWPDSGPPEPAVPLKVEKRLSGMVGGVHGSLR